MILAVFVAFFIVAGAIALPQFILKECGQLTIKKSIIIRIIMSISYFVLIVFLMTFIDSKDQNVEYFEYLFKFLKDYTVRYENFEWINIWHGLIDMDLYNNVVWISIIFFFPQLTLLIPQFLFIKFKEYAEYVEVTATNRVEVSVDSDGDVSAREANIYSTIRPYLYKTVIAIIVSVAIFVPILFGIIKYISPIYSILIIIGLDILILVLTLVIGRKK
jgi:hypothetical protein